MQHIQDMGSQRYVDWFRSGVSLDRALRDSASAVNRLRAGVVYVRSGFESGVGLTSVALDEVLAAVRNSAELSGLAHYEAGALKPAAPGAAASVARVQMALDLLCDSYRRDADSAQAGETRAFMSGYEVVLMGVERFVAEAMGERERSMRAALPPVPTEDQVASLEAAQEQETHREH